TWRWVKPGGGGPSPNCCRKLRPMLEVTSDEVDIVPRTLLRIATGSPGTLALGTIGSVGSQAPSQFPPLPCGRLGEPGAAGSHRSDDAARGRASGPPAGADQLRAASRLAWAGVRSSPSRVTSCCCSPNLCCAEVRAATAAFWLD